MQALMAMTAGLDDAVAAYRDGDLATAAQLFETLAEEGCVEAQAWIGALHANGEGVPADLAQAFRWYLRAAEGGHVPAQTNVGAMLIMGSGTPPDPELGLHWLRTAAEAGDAMAQSNLATLYFKGQGTAQDEALAAQHGVGSALNALEGMIGQMSAEEKQKGAALFDQWRSRTAAVSSPARLIPVPG